MEKIMSKDKDTNDTNDTSNLDHRTLTDTELDAVSGGIVISIIGILVG
jgi:bacteriocin-like protein